MVDLYAVRHQTWTMTLQFWAGPQIRHIGDRQAGELGPTIVVEIAQFP
jgi:hypothetical protein